MTNIPEVDIIQKNLHNNLMTHLCNSEVKLIMITDDGTKIVLHDGNDKCLENQKELIKEAFIGGTLCSKKKEVLMRFAIHHRVTEIIDVFFKNGFIIQNMDMLSCVSLDEETIDYMFDAGYSLIDIINTVCDLDRMDLLYYLDECGRIDKEFLSLYDILMWDIDDDIFLFFLKKYSENDPKYTINDHYAKKIGAYHIIRIPTKHLQLLIDEYNLDIHKGADYLWHQVCFNYDETVIEILLPYYSDKLPKFDSYFFSFKLLAIPKLQSVNYILSLGANIHHVEEALETDEASDHSHPSVYNFITATNQILKNRMFNFYENNIVTPDNRKELFDACLDIVKKPINIEISLFSDLETYLNFYNFDYVDKGIGIYITTINGNVIQLVEPKNHHVFGEYIEISQRSGPNLHEQVSNALFQHELTQEMKDFLFIHCISLNRCNTGILLRQHGAHVHINFNYEDIGNIKAMKNTEIVEILLETGTDISTIFKTAVNSGFTETVRYLVQNYHNDLDVSLLMNCRLTDIAEKREIVEMLVELFIEIKNFDINDIFVAKHFIGHNFVQIQTEKCICETYKYLLSKGLDYDVMDLLCKPITSTKLKLLGMTIVNKLDKYGERKACEDMVQIMKMLDEIYSQPEGGMVNGLDDMLNMFFQLDICDGNTMKKIMHHYENNEKWEVCFYPGSYLLTSTKYRVDALLNKYAEELMC